MQNCLLTIGIPTYNGGNKLPGLLASLKNLSLNDGTFELLIVDNNSEDDTEVVIEQLKATHNNIIYYKNDFNIGRIENWNRVIELTRGEFLILMNVNDRFLEFNITSCLNFLVNNPQIPLVMNDVLFENFRYPNWVDEGVIDFKAYIKKTFLDVNYLEFHALGVLQQHIFRTEVIKANNIGFDTHIPRTADRVFIAQVIKMGGANFLYTAKPIVSWHLNSGRYHHQVHNNLAGFNFNDLWGNEYEANRKVADIAGISYIEVLRSQLILAGFMKLAKWFRVVKKSVFANRSADNGIEISTSHLYYRHLRAIAKQNKVPVHFFAINMQALKRATIWFLRSARLLKTNPRTIKEVTVSHFITLIP